ncbi:MAG: response regulator [Bdellovibrionota bacterium]
MMPNKDGVQVCKEIREAESASNSESHIPILMLTARDGIKDKVMALDAGADDYLTKPFDLNELTARMNAL